MASSMMDSSSSPLPSNWASMSRSTASSAAADRPAATPTSLALARAISSSHTISSAFQKGLLGPSAPSSSMKSPMSRRSCSSSALGSDRNTLAGSLSSTSLAMGRLASSSSSPRSAASASSVFFARMSTGRSRPSRMRMKERCRACFKWNSSSLRSQSWYCAESRSRSSSARKRSISSVSASRAVRRARARSISVSNSSRSARTSALVGAAVRLPVSTSFTIFFFHTKASFRLASPKGLFSAV